MKRISEIIWDATTAIVADTIALFSPEKGAQYRNQRSVYKRAYLATEMSGPYEQFRPSLHSGDREVLTAASKITAKTRDLSRNNPLVAGVELKRATAVVGDEVGVKAQVLDSKGKPNKILNKDLEDRFFRWAEGAEAGGWNLTKCLHLIENHLLNDGEIFIKASVLPGSKGNPFRIQLFERDHLDVSKGLYGIDFDDFGKPLRYYLRKWHPGGLLPMGKSSLDEAMTVPAEDMRHIAETTRASQRRGISPLASAIYKLYGCDDLEDTEIIGARQGAHFGLVIKSKTPELSNLSGVGPQDGTETPKDVNDNDRQYMDPHGGAILTLAPDEEAMPFNSNRPNPNFEAFIRGRERKAIATTGMSYELGSGDFSNSSYSASKMARNMEWAVILRRQRVLKDLLNWIYRQWLRYEVSLVGIPGISLGVFNRNPIPFEQCTWQLAGNQGADISKEVQALEAEIALGVNNRTNYCAERGRDFQEIAKGAADEKEILTELGIYRESPVVPEKTVSTGDQAKGAIEDEEPESEEPEDEEPEPEPKTESES